MMDGRVGAIRKALDDAGLAQTPILSYASKFASAFYGPFREAADSAPQFGDRRSYQMDGANLREAMREIELDLDEGADMILMKPAMPYLDVVRAARERFGVPMGAYQVSGEYSMLQAAFRKRLARPRPRHAGVAGRHPPRRRRLHRHLLRQGRRQAALMRQNLFLAFLCPGYTTCNLSPLFIEVSRCTSASIGASLFCCPPPCLRRLYRSTPRLSPKRRINLSAS